MCTKLQRKETKWHSLFYIPYWKTDVGQGERDPILSSLNLSMFVPLTFGWLWAAEPRPHICSTSHSASHRQRHRLHLNPDRKQLSHTDDVCLCPALVLSRVLAQGGLGFHSVRGFEGLKGRNAKLPLCVQSCETKSLTLRVFSIFP